MAEYGFWYADHSLEDPENVETMRKLRGNERGIPVILFNGKTLVGLDRYRLKTLLNLH